MLAALFDTIAWATNIEECGDIGSYKPTPFVALAVELQSLGKDEAIIRLQRWASSKKYDEQVILLCRMLFESRKNMAFRAPMLGGAGFYGGTSEKDWPLEPIVIIDDIPFLIVSDYALFGHAEEAPPYLHYCLSNTDWASRHYHLVSRVDIETAFQKLLKAPLWKRPLNWREVNLLKRQME
jgi:hypothetical protein